MTSPRYNAALTCLKPAPWTAYAGICTQPANHSTRCKYVAAELVEVYSIAPECARV